MDPKLRSECVSLIDRYLLRLPIKTENDFDLAWQALQTVISSKKQFVVHPKFSSHIIGIYDFFSMPEIYVPEEDLEEFKDILRERIKFKINDFKTYDAEEKISYINNFLEDKEKSEKYHQKIASLVPPEPGTEAHTISEEQMYEEMQDNEMGPFQGIFNSEEWQEMSAPRRNLFLDYPITIQHFVNDYFVDSSFFIDTDRQILEHLLRRSDAVDALIEQTGINFFVIASLENEVRQLLLTRPRKIIYLVNNIQDLDIDIFLTLSLEIQKELLNYYEYVKDLVNEANIPLDRLVTLPANKLHVFLAYPGSMEANTIYHQLRQPNFEEEPAPTKKINLG